MRPLPLVLILVGVSLSTTAFAEEGFCRKCQVMREYHREHPSKYTYYEDYLKDLEEKGATAVNPSEKDLPPDVEYIMHPEKTKAPPIAIKK